MKLSGKCPKCASTDIISDAEAVDRGGKGSEYEMTVATIGNPEAFFFRDKRQTTLSAWVCASCGFIEYYADFPAKLKTPKT
jgi:predicted nucleic-acid-binding Zn-ribbon protein